MPSDTPQGSGDVVAELSSVYDALDRAKTAYGDLSTVGRTSVFALSSAYGVSAERDIVDAPNGSVTNPGGEYKVSTDAVAGAETKFESSQLGIYIPDYEAVAGLALRRPTPPTGDQDVRWGYYNGTDGLFFGEDSESPFVGRRVSGNDEEFVRQGNWNLDTLDGSGDADNPSGLELSLSDGVITHQRPALYNYGRGTFVFLIRNPPTARDGEANEIAIVPVHRLAPRGERTLRSQNLPISMYVSNGQSATGIDYYVGGRQYSLLGDYSPQQRVKGEWRPNPNNTGTVSITTSAWSPLVAFKRKNDFQSQQVKLRLLSYSIFSDVDAYIQVRSNATVSGGSYGAPTDVKASETAVETNTTATGVTISDGELRYPDLVKGGQGSHTSLSRGQGVDVHVNREQVTVLAARAISSNGSIAASSVKWEELW